jgi:hypothetical protein
LTSASVVKVWNSSRYKEGPALLLRRIGAGKAGQVVHGSHPENHEEVVRGDEFNGSDICTRCGICAM